MVQKKNKIEIKKVHIVSVIIVLLLCIALALTV